MSEVLVSNGAILFCREVPPYAVGVVHRAVPEPVFPKVVLTSAAGSTEKLPALPDTPEFQEYQQQMRNYRRKIGELSMEFHINYCVTSWKFPGSDEVHEDPPDDWNPDRVYMAYGGANDDRLSDAMHRRYLYITLNLLTSSDDAALVDGAMGTAQSSPVTKGEVDAAIAPFGSAPPKDGQ